MLKRSSTSFRRQGSSGRVWNKTIESYDLPKIASASSSSEENGSHCLSTSSWCEFGYGVHRNFLISFLGLCMGCPRTSKLPELFLKTILKGL